MCICKTPDSRSNHLLLHLPSSPYDSNTVNEQNSSRSSFDEEDRAYFLASREFKQKQKGRNFLSMLAVGIKLAALVFIIINAIGIQKNNKIQTEIMQKTMEKPWGKSHGSQSRTGEFNVSMYTEVDSITVGIVGNVLSNRDAAYQRIQQDR